MRYKSNTGVGADLYSSAHKCVGQIRGGLAISTVAACAGFAAISGTTVAGLVTMGRVALPEMRKYRYSDALATGCIASGGTMGILIPPSMGFILYGVLTEVSIGHLFMAGILPGVLQAVFYIAAILILCRINPQIGPPGPKTSLKEKVVSLKNTWSAIVLFLLVIGGIYLGIFTPTEAGAVGAFGAIVLTFLSRRLKGRNLLNSILESAQMTAMMILIMAGAFTFMNLMAMSKLPFVVADLVVGLSLSKYFIIAAIIVMYIILGMFLDIISSILVTVPILFPVVSALGFDPVWYGVIMVRVMEIGLITPPFGLDVFTLSGISRIPVSTIFRGVTPFVITDFLHIALLVAFPAVSLFIPSMMAKV